MDTELNCADGHRAPDAVYEIDSSGRCKKCGTFLLGGIAPNPTIPKYEEGMLVELKSGGPPMTVECVRSNGWVEVSWFNGEAFLSRDCFNPKTLKVVPCDEA